MLARVTAIGAALLAAGIAVAILAAPGAGSAAGAVAAAPRCTTDQLKISTGPVPGGLQHFGLALEFHNRGPRCSLEGYPGVAGLSAQGTTVFNAERQISGYLGGARQITTVTLASGGDASAMFEWLATGAVGGPACLRYRQLEVTPPGALDSVTLHVAAAAVCTPQVHPVVAGRKAGAG